MRTTFSRALISTLLLLVACTPAAPAPATPATGGSANPTAAPARAADQSLRVSVSALNPNIAPESSGILVWFNSIVFDSLTRLDDKLVVQPGIAEKWEALPNDEGWRYTIRKDLLWPDGSRVTANDVDYTVKSAITNKWAVVSNFPNVTGSRLVDENTVDLLTKTRDVTVPVNGAYLFIVPQKAYEAAGKDAFALKPVGSGPYEVVEFKPNDSVTYKKRANLRHPFRNPTVTDLRIRVVPEQSSVLAGLRSRDLDLAISGFTPDTVDAATRDGFQVLRRITSNYLVLVDANATQNSPLNRKEVRQALNYAIDRDTICKTILRGACEPMGQLGLPNTPMRDENLKPYPFDQAKAKQLLAQAGYANGFTLAGGIDFSPPFHSEPITLAMQDYFKQIGVEAKINSHDSSVWQDKLFGRNGNTRSELYAVTYGDANGFLTFGRSLLTCSNPQPARLVCVEDFDRYMNQAYGEPDAARRAELLKQANRAFVDAMPAVFITASAAGYLYSPKVKDFAPANVTFYTLDPVYKID